jgi:hypothetical protein
VEGLVFSDSFILFFLSFIRAELMKRNAAAILLLFLSVPKDIDTQHEGREAVCDVISFIGAAQAEKAAPAISI